MQYAMTILMALTFGLKLLAADGFACVPQSGRETRVQFLKNENELELRITNPSGYEQMPQFEGPTSLLSLGLQKMQFSDLRAIDQVFITKWTLANCDYDFKNFTVHCNGKAIDPAADLKVLGLTTTEVREKYKDEIFEKRKYRISVEKNSNYYFVTLFFNNQTCFNFQ